MKRTTGLALVAMAALVLTQACAHHPMNFEPGEIDADYYVKKVDQFIVIADESMSMGDRSHHTQKIQIEEAFLASLNETIPELDYVGGFRTFGKNCQAKGKTVLVRDVSPYGTNEFESALDQFRLRRRSQPARQGHRGLGRRSHHGQADRGDHHHRRPRHGSRRPSRLPKTSRKPSATI